MLIKALCDYYDVLAQKEKVLPEGYSTVDIKYLVSITEKGDIDSIIDWQITETDAKGKLKKLPRKILLPQRTQKTGIESNIIEHRALYIFGLNYDKDNGALTVFDKTKKAEKSHDAFKAENLEFLEGLDSPVINAYRNLIENWQPSEQEENVFLSELGSSYVNATFAFCLSGRPDILLHEDRLIKEKFADYYAKQCVDEGVCLQCSIYGTHEKSARLHDKVKGFTATGSVLVNFNNPSEESYGKSQAFNSSISETAMRKYTEALNYLLSSKKNKTLLGDITLVHWSADGNEDFDNLFACGYGDDIDDSETSDENIKKIIGDAKDGKLDWSQVKRFTESIGDNIDYYVIGLKPNSSRLALKFIYRRKFGEIIENFAKHQEDLRLTEEDCSLPLWKIVRSLSRPGETSPSYNPALMTKMLEAIINGYNYPSELLSCALRRIKLDSDDEMLFGTSWNEIRRRIIKAFINRKARLSGKKEEIQMGLDLENKNPAYLCGRLFAVLEEIQKKAYGNLNRTIRDSYFSSASTRPSAVFPKILRLSQHHLSKPECSKSSFDENIGAIMANLGNDFPKSLSLTEQGVFVIGYYHQKYSNINKTN